MTLLVRQIDESESRLKHKAETFATRCDQLNDTVKESVEQKIINIGKMEKSILKEVASIKEDGTTRYGNINKRILELKDKIRYNIKEGRSNHKVGVQEEYIITNLSEPTKYISELKITKENLYHSFRSPPT